MKRCPRCNRVGTDDSLIFCRTDGTRLVADSLSSEEAATAILPQAPHGGAISTGPLHSKPSIAVLPFADLSAGRENEYFCDGPAEELPNALTKVEGLKVAARTSSFSFKGKDATVGDMWRAFEWLEKAYAARACWLVYAKICLVARRTSRQCLTQAAAAQTRTLSLRRTLK